MAYVQPEFLHSFQGHQSHSMSVAISSTADVLVSGGMDKGVMVYSSVQPFRVFRYVGHTDVVSSVDYFRRSIDPIGLVVSGSYDHYIKVWKCTVSGESISRKSHTGRIHSVSFSSDGQLVLSAGDDKIVRLQYTEGLRHCSTLSGHTNWVRQAAFSEDSNLIGSCSDDGTIKIWDRKIQKCVQSLPTRNISLYGTTRSSISITTCLQWATSNIIAGGIGPNVYFWDLRNPSNVLMSQDTSNIGSSNDIVKSICFTPDTYVIGSSDGCIRIFSWTAGTPGTLEYILKAHKGGVNGVAYAKQFQLGGNIGNLASTGEDGKVIYWKTAKKGCEIQSGKNLVNVPVKKTFSVSQNQQSIRNNQTKSSDQQSSRGSSRGRSERGTQEHTNLNGTRKCGLERENNTSKEKIPLISQEYATQLQQQQQGQKKQKRHFCAVVNPKQDEMKKNNQLAMAHDINLDPPDPLMLIKPSSTGDAIQRGNNDINENSNVNYDGQIDDEEGEIEYHTKNNNERALPNDGNSDEYGTRDFYPERINQNMNNNTHNRISSPSITQCQYLPHQTSLGPDIVTLISDISKQVTSINRTLLIMNDRLTHLENKMSHYERQQQQQQYQRQQQSPNVFQIDYQPIQQRNQSANQESLGSSSGVNETRAK